MGLPPMTQERVPVPRPSTRSQFVHDGGVPPESWRVWTVSIWQTDTFCKGFPFCSHVLISSEVGFDSVFPWLSENEQEPDRQETREPKFERGNCSKPQGSGSVGRDQLAHRADEYARGHWDSLLRAARQTLFNLSEDEERISTRRRTESGLSKARCREPAPRNEHK